MLQDAVVAEKALAVIAAAAQKLAALPEVHLHLTLTLLASDCSHMHTDNLV